MKPCYDDDGWDPNTKRRLQTIDEGIGKELIYNFTTYINEDDTMEEIEEFMSRNINSTVPIKTQESIMIKVDFNIKWEPNV